MRQELSEYLRYLLSDLDKRIRDNFDLIFLPKQYG